MLFFKLFKPFFEAVILASKKLFAAGVDGIFEQVSSSNYLKKLFILQKSTCKSLNL